MDTLKLDQSLEPKIMSTAALLESAALARDPNKDIEAITKKLFLKNLLTLPSSSTTALLAVEANPSSPPKVKTTALSIVTTSTDNMITKEINDAQLNLTKILYEPDENLDTEIKDKDHEFSLNGKSTPVIDMQVDDDDRLVIDISDDEKKEKKRRRKGKMYSPLKDKLTKFVSNQLPKSITYNLETTPTGVSSSVKIDILATNVMTHQTETSAANMTKSPNKNSNISVSDELSLLGHEVDRQMSRKSKEVVELIKSFLSSTLTKEEFYNSMNEVGNVTMSDISLIARKLIKRHKFEPNPNQNCFLKMKLLQFQTGGKDLVKYFESLLPSFTKEKFMEMVRFYEIIIKEMLNLNRTKILQYLVDFMVKRKNSQLDLLNYNFLATSGVNIKGSSSIENEQMQLNCTQQPPSERKPLKFFDTSYNFVVRSDPIYMSASSKFQTNIRNVIRCRSSSGVQMNNFELRPFDNNILRNRRIGKRLVNERENLKEMHAIPEKMRRPNDMKMSKFQTAQIQPAKIQNSSPILVSDTPPPSENSSPPPIQIQPYPSAHTDKPKILHHYVLQRAFSEQVPTTTAAKKLQSPNNDLQKFDFPKITTETPVERLNSIKQHPKRRPSVKAVNYQFTNQIPVVVNGEPVEKHITVNELKTLSDNGTEIIPTSTLKNTTASRRKTVDERAQILKTTPTTVEVKKVAPVPPMSEPIKPTAESAHRALMKRRQSCHERILASSASHKVNEANIEKNYLNFLTRFENMENDVDKMRKMQQSVGIQKQHLIQEALHGIKQVRFEEAPVQNQQPVRSNPIQYMQTQQQVQMQHQLMPRTSNYFEQQHQKFVQERLMRDRYYDRVETLQDRDASLNQRQNLVSPKSTRAVPEKAPRMTQRTPVMNDEKMMMVAYQQLQSLRDPSSFGLQQYAEQLKNLHQHKPGFVNIPQQTSPNETFYQKAQHHQQAIPTTTVPPLSFFYPTTDNTSNSLSSNDQSLQKKLKLKSKTVTNYVEPNQAVNKPFYNPPHSTYYSDPYAPTLKKTPPVPTSHTAFHPPPQLVERSSAEMHLPSQQQLQNFWMLQRQQNSQPNIARPIPINSRVQGPPAFDAKIPNVSFPVQALQQEQQSEYYRQFYQQHHPKNY